MKLETKTEGGTKIIIEGEDSLFDPFLLISVPEFDIKRAVASQEIYRGQEERYKGKRILGFTTGDTRNYIDIESTEGLEEFLADWQEEKQEREEAQLQVNVFTLGGVRDIIVDNRKSVEEIVNSHQGFIKNLENELKNPRKDFREAVEEAKNKKKEEEQKQKELEREQQEKFERVRKEAEKTGEKVLLEKQTVPCSDPKEECSLDIVNTFITPEGKEETEVIHTH